MDQGTTVEIIGEQDPKTQPEAQWQPLTESRTGWHFDAIVVGCGIIGLSACWQLAKRGLKVLAVDRYPINHHNGSSKNFTRILKRIPQRLAGYAKLYGRSVELWSELNTASEFPLIDWTGVLHVGSPVSGLFDPKQSGVDHPHYKDVHLDYREICEKHPEFNFPSDHLGLFEVVGGVLYAERARRILVDEAARMNVMFLPNVFGHGIQCEGSSYLLRTARQDYRAENVILATGAWMEPMMYNRKIKMTVIRKNVFYYAVNEAPGKPERDPKAEPPVVTEFQGRRMHSLRMPPAFQKDRVIKVVQHSHTEQERRYCLNISSNRFGESDTDNQYRNEDEARARQYLTEVYCGIDESVEPLEETSCHYTLSPDNDFMIGQHPDLKNVYLATGFCGRGFSYAPAIGEMISNLAVGDPVDDDYWIMDIERFYS